MIKQYEALCYTPVQLHTHQPHVTMSLLMNEISLSEIKLPTTFMKSTQPIKKTLLAL